MAKDLNGKELGEGLCQLKDGRYLGRYTDKFGKRKTIYGKRLKDVKEKLRKAQYEDALLSGKVDVTKITLNDLYSIWYKEKSYTIRNSTLAMYNTIYEKNIKPDIGLFCITQITLDDIQKFLNELKDKKMSTAYIQTHKSILHNMFKFAINKRMLMVNPCTGVNTSVSMEEALKKIEKHNDKVLSQEQAEKLLNYAQTSKSIYIDIFKAMVLTGMRVGEAIALTWKDIDLDNRTVRVNKTYYLHLENHTSVLDYNRPPKTRSSVRNIPMCDTMYSMLKRRKQIAIENNIPSVFWGREEQRLVYAATWSGLKRIINNFNKQEIRLAKEENREPIIVPDIGCHGFRHTFASICFEKEIPPKVIQKYLGHKKISTTMDIYTHVSEKVMLDNINKIDGII